MHGQVGFEQMNFQISFGFWILDFGIWYLVFGIWILDFGFWILDKIARVK